MGDATILTAKQLFGIQIKNYREATGLTQKEFADFTSTSDTYAGKVERGEVNIGIDNMVMFSSAFGVEFYELANTNFPIPELAEMPKRMREYVAHAKRLREIRSEEPSIKITAYLDPIIASNFLLTPQTARMIADEIERTSGVTIPPGRITSELTKAPRNLKVKVVDRPDDRTEPGNWYQLIE